MGEDGVLEGSGVQIESLVIRVSILSLLLVAVRPPAAQGLMATWAIRSENSVLCSLVGHSLIFKILRSRKQGTFALVPSIYQRMAFLLPVTGKGRAIFSCQGEVRGDTFPETIAEE